MTRMGIACAAAGLMVAAGRADDKGGGKMAGPLDQKVTALDGTPLDLAKFKGKVVLVVNVASRCGYTPQYAGLQELSAKFAADGLVVLGVPANEFGAQEPGSEADIQKFCATKYHVTFPMTSKMVVKGPGQAPLFATLTDNDKDPIGWNFEKFLIGRNGKVAARFKSGVEPDSDELLRAVKKELEAK